ncbi:MAG: nucleoside-diphosphate kinase [Bacteroidetes bacterium]|uniref:Nucleoside diphosphate kinase n=1 Tax=Candidatus Enterocola intestinipullorum TaxID=2840783 RepID=A0A9D9EJ23_9BACT|nr:nucleoside-diphosphate kinase [Candidatus Enterocola intestinipullorum]
MERTLVILKPGAVIRGLAGEVISRFEKKGLQIAGLKMMRLDDAVLDEHYAHLKDKPFFPRIKASMMAAPVIVCCVEGLDAVSVVREMTGCTNCRKAPVGTIRGDFGMSMQENVVHTSDSPENAVTELARFFKEDEIFTYDNPLKPFRYSSDEMSNG